MLANWIETEHFSIEWGNDMILENGHAVVDVNGNGVPEVVEEWASYFEASFDLIVEQLGFGDPLFEERLIPVYFGNSDLRPEVIVEDIGVGTYGFTFFVQDEAHLLALQEGEDGLTAEQASYFPVGVPHIVVNNDLLFSLPHLPDGFVYNGEGASAPGDTGDKIRAHISGAMKVTAAHELFHVIHYLYEPPSFVFSQDAWWWEATSTWLEDEAFDRVNDYYQYYGEFGWSQFVEFGFPVNRFAFTWDIQAYGDAIFVKYLTEHVGGRAAVHEVWERMRSENLRILPALDEFAQDRGLAGRRDLVQGFVAANADMDYDEGEHFGIGPDETVAVRKESLIADSSESADFLPLPGYLGTTYLRGRVDVSGSAAFQLTGFSSPLPEAAWGLALSIRKPAGYSLALASSDDLGAPRVSVTQLSAADEIHAGVVFLDDFSAPTRYVTSVASVPAGDTLPPGAISQLRVSALKGRGAGLGGAAVSWMPPVGADLAGYVVRWRRPGGTYASRTIFGTPLDPGSGAVQVELRSLVPSVSYEFEVWAYDAAGNEGPHASAAATSGAAPSAQVPPVAILARDVSLAGVNVAEATSDDGKGIGGFDCFIRALDF